MKEEGLPYFPFKQGCSADFKSHPGLALLRKVGVLVQLSWLLSDFCQFESESLFEELKEQ